MQDLKLTKNRHLCTIAQLCRAISSQLRSILTIRNKNAKQQYLFQTSPQYSKLRSTNGKDRSAGLGHPSKFQWVLRLGFVTAATSFTRGQPNFAHFWPSPGLVHYMYISGAFAPDRICQVQTSLCIQVLRSPILAALLHGTRPVGISQTLRYGTRNGITELSQRVAITFGIGPHSSILIIHLHQYKTYWCVLLVQSTEPLLTNNNAKNQNSLGYPWQ